LKQLGLAYLMYMQDYDEAALPHMTSAGPHGRLWPQLLYPYMMNLNLFVCPSRPTPLPQSIDDDFTTIGYAMNILCSGAEYPHKSSDIKYPAGTAVIVDGGAYYLWYTGYYRYEEPDSDLYGINGTATLQGQHPGGDPFNRYGLATQGTLRCNIFAFCDGHAMIIPLDWVHEQTGRHDRFNNWDSWD
jgi:hypothetical protein